MKNNECKTSELNLTSNSKEVNTLEDPRDQFTPFVDSRLKAIEIRFEKLARDRGKIELVYEITDWIKAELLDLNNWVTSNGLEEDRLYKGKLEAYEHIILSLTDLAINSVLEVRKKKHNA